MKVLNFEISGDFGHFKPYDTTSSPTTYTCIPPTTVYGIIGAILGLEREQYYNKLKNANTRVGIGLLKKPRKMTMSINLINTKNDYWIPSNKNSAGPRAPTRYEFLVNPAFNIFVSMEDEDLLYELAKRIKEHRHFYTPSLGLANLIADICYKDYADINLINSSNYIKLCTAINVDDLDKTDDSIDFTKNITYAKDRFVTSFKENRVPEKYVDIIYSLDGQDIYVKTNKAYCLKNNNFTFLT